MQARVWALFPSMREQMKKNAKKKKCFKDAVASPNRKENNSKLPFSRLANNERHQKHFARFAFFFKKETNDK